MKNLLLALVLASTASAAPVSDHLGLQLWSLHAIAMQHGWRAGLDEAQRLGFRYVEGGVPPEGMSPEAYKAALSAHGLSMVSMGFGYEKLSKDLAGCVAAARALGVDHVMVAWIPHSGDAFTRAEAEQAARDFNAWGAAFREAGIVFTYHPHGYEFRPDAGGDTLFDLIARSTRPESINFEMDVFWVTHGGANPVALLKKYPNRWKMMHVKDIRLGAPTGIYTGHAPATDDVPVGTGQVDWKAVFSQARLAGIEWYFIEDESLTPLDNIPRSVAFIKSLGP